MATNTLQWDQKKYKQFIQMLLSKQDLSYQQFHRKLILDELPVIGIRSPELKKIAKEISKENYMEFIKLNQHYYYEETMIHGLILGYLKIDFPDLIKKIDEFLPYNTNWAINDSTCANLKQFKTHQEEGFQWILKKLQSNNPWDIRFSFVLLLDYYINDQYIDTILKLVQKSYPDHYYINMAIAWLLSKCYIKYPKKTEILLSQKKMKSWIQNKTISKIRDSYCVSHEQKDYLKEFLK